MGQKLHIDITVVTELASVRADWLDLQSRGLTTLYQTFEWCDAWRETIGAEQDVEPQIVVGRRQDGQVAFILPLAVRRTGGYRIIEWLAVDVASYGLGLYDIGFLDRSPHGLAPYWPAIVDALPQADAIWLCHLPQFWRDRQHPLADLFTTPSANKTFQISLEPSYDALYASKRSSGSRRGAHKRDKRLLASGDVHYGLPLDDADGDRLIDAMIDQHAGYLAARGVHNVLAKQTPAFLKRLAASDHDSGLTMYPQYLQVDGRLVAAKIGFIFDRMYWAMISSLDAGDLHKFSPGDFALRKTIETCCERGLELLDFATGDSDYKHHWADRSVMLHELIQARTARGMVWAAAKRASVDTKRMVKNSTFLWPKLAQLRKAALGNKN